MKQLLTKYCSIMCDGGNFRYDVHCESAVIKKVIAVQ